MIIFKQAPALLVIIPLLGAFAINIGGWFNKRVCHPLTVLAMLGSFAACVITLMQVVKTGPISFKG